MVLLGATLVGSPVWAANPTQDEAQPGALEDATGVTDENASAEAPVHGYPPAPVGVRFAEALEGKRLSVAYSWERIQGQGLRAGRNKITPDHARDVLGFTTTPRSLQVTIHTVQVAYAPHPRVTLVAEVPILRKELETVDAAGTRSHAHTDGVGDIGFYAVVPFIRKGSESSQIHLGFDAPTGAYRRGGDDMRLPYDNQIGNGSWDFEWGLTYQGGYQRVSWGGQALGRHPIGRNGVKYREGSRFVGTVWGAVRMVAGLSLSFRTEWAKQNNINGFDRTLRPDFDPSENAKLRGGERITLSPGLSLDVPRLNNQRFAVEFGIPVYQRLDGPQVERDWSFKGAWRWVY